MWFDPTSGIQTFFEYFERDMALKSTSTYLFLSRSLNVIVKKLEVNRFGANYTVQTHI